MVLTALEDAIHSQYQKEKYQETKENGHPGERDPSLTHEDTEIFGFLNSALFYTFPCVYVVI